MDAPRIAEHLRVGAELGRKCEDRSGDLLRRGRCDDRSRLRRLGVPYSEAEVAASTAAVKGKTEMDALVAYLQSLGTHVK